MKRCEVRGARCDACATGHVRGLTVRMTAAGIVAAAALTSACSGETARAQGASTPPAAAPAATIEVVKVSSAPLNVTVPLPAELQPYETVPIFAKVSGFVTSIAVDRGSHVRRGQTLVRLEAPELVAQRAEAEARVQTAQAQLAAAEARLASDEGTYQRLRRASATPGVVAGNDLETSQRTAEADRAHVQAQAQQVAAARQSLQAMSDVARYLEIAAPFDGIITERNAHPGALVGPAGAASGATPILRIENVARLRLVVPVPETYIAGIREGRSVSFAVPAYPGRTFSGTIARVSHAVDVRTRTMPVEIEVMNGDNELAAGTFSDVRWPVERPEPTLFVPSGAVTSTLDRTFVVRIANGKAEWVDVRPGVASGKLLEVFGNLRAGDTVAARGTDEIKPGTAVQVKIQNVAPGDPRFRM